jgi:hypothetical protein
MNVLLTGSRTTYVAVTDEAGVFSFDSVEPGNYRISIERAGYRSKPANETSALYHLDRGQKIAGVGLTATPLGAISGTVRNADGEPIVEAHVSVGRATWLHGRRATTEVKSVLTDDRGLYRADGLEPGEYFVRASGSGGWGSVADGPGQPEFSTTPAFYSGLKGNGLVPLSIGAGQELEGIDVRLPLEPAFHIRGKVDPKPADTVTNKAPYVEVSLDEGGPNEWTGFYGQIAEDGSFDVPGVPDGDYVLQEVSGMRGINHYSARIRVRVESGDASGVLLTEARFGVAIEARFDGDESHDLSKWAARLEPVDWRGPTLATFGASHVILGVSPGRYILAVSTNEEAYVKQVLLNGRVVSDPDLALSNADDKVEIVFAKGTGTVDGRFVWTDPKPVGVSAVLVSDPPRPGDYAVVHHTDIDQRGEFRFVRIAPGRYRSFVVTDFDEGLWENREFFRLIADKGVGVDMPEDATGAAAVRIQPALLPVSEVERAIAQMKK